jgi:DUF438 domain-containing protein
MYPLCNIGAVLSPVAQKQSRCFPLPSNIALNAFDHINVGAVVINKDNQIVFFNKLAGEFLHQDTKSRISTSIFLCHPERAEPGVLDMIEKMKSGELEKYQGWVNFRGRVFYEYIYPLHDEKGAYVGAVAEFHNVPEKLEAAKKAKDFKLPEMHGKGPSSPRSPR